MTLSWVFFLGVLSTTTVYWAFGYPKYVKKDKQLKGVGKK